MALYLGLDTSNYTTSAAVYDSETHAVRQAKQLLPVKPGEKGLRQSDAVFHHTVQLPEVLAQVDFTGCAGIGVSGKPRQAEGSYMPCFLCGAGAARMLGQALSVPVYITSHQTGHILAALYAAGKLSLLGRPFIAFHVSGGTTECVLCEPDEKRLIHIEPLAGSLDLKAGQLIDRVGIMLGLRFPCGAELERLAGESQAPCRYQPVCKGADCCLSGLENQCRDFFAQGHSPQDTARFCLTAVAEVLAEMTERVLADRPLPVLYAGGVMSDKLIQERLTGDGRYFASPEFSCDNAVGTALFAAAQQEGLCRS